MTKYVEVKWTDSGLHLHDDWAPVEQYVAKAKAANMVATTVGMLLHRDDDITIIGMSRDDCTGDIFGAQVILNKNIVTARAFYVEPA